MITRRHFLLNSALFRPNNVLKLAWLGGSGESSATIDFLQETPSELVAPVGIWFRASGHTDFTVNDFSLVGNNYDPLKHQVYHIWNFDDAGTFSNTDLNIPTVWNNSGVDYNHDAYHVFDTPGSYDVSLWAVDGSGNIGTATETITVLDPDTVFSGTRTICVSGASNFTGKPTSAQEVTTISAAISAANTLAPTSCRILLRRGETFTENNNIGSSLTSIRIGAFGTGAKPIVRPVAPAAGSDAGGTCFNMSNGNSVAQMTFYDIRLEGDWDATTETGAPKQHSFSFDVQNTTAYNALFYRLETTGFERVIKPTTDTVDFTIGMVDCSFTNWRTYGMFLVGEANNDNHKLAIVGTSLHAPQNCCLGNRGVNEVGQVNGTLRYGDIQNFITSACSFYNASGDIAPNQQPCMRMAQSSTSTQRTYNIYMNRTYVEGGSVLLGIDGMNGTITEWPGNHVLDMMLLVGCWGTDWWAQSGFGGTTYRNIVFYNPSITTRIKTPSTMRFIDNSPDHSGVGTGNYDAPITASHNTFLNLDDEGAMSTVLQSGPWVNNTTTDNINHQPNSGIDAGVDVTENIAGVQTLNRGRRMSHDRPTATALSVGKGVSFTCSYPSGTNAADFSGGTRHGVYIGGSFWFQHFGHCTFSFGDSEITVTNNSGATMDGTATLFMEQTTLKTDTAYDSPPDIPLPRLSRGAAGTGAGDPGPYTDFAARVAPGLTETGQDATGTSRSTTGRNAGAVQEVA